MAKANTKFISFLNVQRLHREWKRALNDFRIKRANNRKNKMQNKYNRKHKNRKR